jgi:hypothetical protein
VDAAVDLLMGPTDAPGKLTVDQLEVAWLMERDRVLDEYRGPPGTRPWAYWRFDLGEEKPANWGEEAIRLAELGGPMSWRLCASARTRPSCGSALAGSGCPGAGCRTAFRWTPAPWSGSTPWRRREGRADADYRSRDARVVDVLLVEAGGPRK